MRATVDQSIRHSREKRAQDVYRDVCMVDCCVFVSYLPPDRPLLQQKFCPPSSIFCVWLCPQEKHVSLQNSQKARECHTSPSCGDVWHLPGLLESPSCSGDSWGQRSTGPRFGPVPQAFPCFVALKKRTKERRMSNFPVKCLT